MPDLLRSLAERYTAAWCSRDAAGVAAFYSPEGSLTINHGQPAVGREAIAAAAQAFMTDFPDLKVIMDSLFVEMNRAAYRWTLVATNTGPGGTGNRVHISGFEEWQIGADGLIVESRGHFDNAEFECQPHYGTAESS
jgi:uncharacterized protein (TIGR02246 family)